MPDRLRIFSGATSVMLSYRSIPGRISKGIEPSTSLRGCDSLTAHGANYGFTVVPTAR